MADFGDPSLFAQFEGPKGPSDRILKQNVLSEGKGKGLLDTIENDSDDECVGNYRKMRMTDNDAGRKSSSSDSSSDDSEGGSDDDSDDEIRVKRTSNSKSNSAQTSSGNGPFGNATGTVSDNKRNEEFLKTIKKLKQENEFLKRQVRLLDPLLWIKDENGPLMQLIFMHSDFAREHRTEIEGFIASLVMQSKNKEKQSRSVFRPRPNDTCLASVKDLSDPMQRILRLRTSMVLNCSQVYDDFLIDMMGSPLVDFNPSLTDGWEIPTYQQVFTQSLPCDEEDEDAWPKQKSRPKSKCFNCGGDHILSKCPEEKDFEEIRKNRREFVSNSTPKQERYHVDDPRFAAFKPGRISDDLRAALALREDQLPPYVYTMRALGYPPGWLEEAKKETGLAMYDREGRELDNDGELLEDGEMNDERVVVKDEYNVEKFIEYPGFNSAIPEGFIDEWQNFAAMPLQQGQDISVMKMHFATPTGLKRKNNGESQGSAKKRKNLDMSTSDMDMGNSDTEEGALASSQASTAPSTPSASIEDLEKQRELLEQELLASIEDSSQGTAPSTPSRSDTAPLESNDTLEATPGTVLSSTPSGPSIGSSLGTPILSDIGDKRTSLPDPSKFRKDIEDHIPYENLPDAQGSYEKLRSLFSKMKDEKRKMSS